MLHASLPYIHEMIETMGYKGDCNAKYSEQEKAAKRGYSGGDTDDAQK